MKIKQQRRNKHTIKIQKRKRLTEKQKEDVLKIPGIELTFVPIVNGYFR